MSTFALFVKDIEALTEIGSKINKREQLSDTEQDMLVHLLQGLPSSYKFLKERFDLDEPLQYQVADFNELQPHINKWVTLFNNLPKNETNYPTACWCAPEDYDDFWKNNVIIEVDFIPSYSFSKRKTEFDKTIGLKLKADGTALFEFLNVMDAEQYKELYSFNGTWKEAYLLVVKTMQQGWPQTKFPEDLEHLLK